MYKGAWTVNILVSFAFEPPMGHGAATMSLLHRFLSFAKACACPHVNPNSFSSISTVLLHVVLSLPRFLFPGGVHLEPTLSIRSCDIRRTRPNHLSRRFFISTSMLVHPVFWYTGCRWQFYLANILVKG